MTIFHSRHLRPHYGDGFQLADSDDCQDFPVQQERLLERDRSGDAMPVTKELKFVIPMPPPSVNRYVRHVYGTTGHRHYKSEEALEFEELFTLFVPPEGLVGQRFGMDIVVYLGKGQHRDADNCLKVVADMVSKCNLIVDPKGKKMSDYWIKKMSSEIRVDDRDHPRTEIRLYVLD